jgi:hypothetical protein
MVRSPEVDLHFFNSIIDPGDKRNYIGNSIYPVIEEKTGEVFAGKITGMLLDETVVDI